MKTLLVLSSVLVAGSLWAQNSPPSNYPFNAENIPQRRDTLLTPKLIQPNEIAGHKVAYSGVAVQIVKTKQPLQLLDPFAPPEYGSGYQNNDRDIITHQSNGIRLFSIHF
jgi:hypothetical protein